MAKIYSVSNAVKKLEALCLESELLLADLSDHTQAKARQNLRVIVTASLHTLMLNSAYSAIYLIKKDITFSSAIIIRSIIEMYVNSRYINAVSDYRNLVRYLYDGDINFIKYTNLAGDMFEKINVEGAFGAYVEDTRGAIKYRVTSSNALKKYGYPLRPMPTFFDRLQVVYKKDSDFILLLTYYYEYVNYSRNVHATKDKIIEMSYAETYNDFFNAVGSNDTRKIKLEQLNCISYLIRASTIKIARQNKMTSNEHYKNIIVNTDEFTTDMSDYQNASKRQYQ